MFTRLWKCSENYYRIETVEKLIQEISRNEQKHLQRFTSILKIALVDSRREPKAIRSL